MCKTTKKKMNDQARLARGLANALVYSVDYVYTDVQNHDMVCLDESLKDTRDMVEKLLESISELEYLAYTLDREI